MTRIDPTTLAKAREWAKDPSYQGDGPSVAAAHVIASLPDTIVDGDKLRELIEEWRTDCPDAEGRMILEQVEALLPAPPLPTLADMTDEERQACRWMQCEVAETENHYSGRGVILYPGDVGRATNVISEDGGWWRGIAMEAVTPLPDLPRMVWPDEHHPATDTDMSKSSPEIDMSRPYDDDVDMKPEDVPDPQPGEAWLIEHEGGYYDAVYWYSPLYAHWALALNREGLTTIESHEATPMRRLVPEVQA